MKTLTATVNKISATVNKIFYVAIALWAVNFILKIEILALVTAWLVPILIVAKPALSYLSKKSKENDPDAIALADAEGDLDKAQANPDNLSNISDEEFTRLEKKKPNLQTWRASHAGKEIVVTNWFSMRKFVGAAELTIDGKKVSRSTVITHDQQKPLLEGNSDEAGGFHTEVFFIGVLKIKAAIVVNGEVILRDKTSWLDRRSHSLAGKIFSQSSDDEKT